MNASDSKTTTATTATELRGSPLDVLRTLLGEHRHEEALAVVETLVARNEELERLLGAMMERKKKGEGFSTKQLDFFIAKLNEARAENAQTDANDGLAKLAAAELEDIKKEREAAERPAPQPRPKRKLPSKLRRVQNPIPVPESERMCPNGHGERRIIDREVTPVIDLIPAEVIVRLDAREVRACRVCEAESVHAPLGDKVVEGGHYGSRLVAHLTVGKYRDGLPLHRMKQQLARLGLEMPSSSMGDQITWATDLLRPVWRGLCDDVLGAAVLHLDSTSLPVLDAKLTSTRLGALWGYVGDKDVAVYLYCSTGKQHGQRPGEIGPVEFLARRKGPTVADAHSMFDRIFRRDGITEIGCNMHSRRYFVKALDGGDNRAAVPISAFKAIYEIEEFFADRDEGERLRARREREKPLYDKLISWAEAHQPHEPPASPLGTAIRYLLNHQVALRRFLDDASLPIDNGIVERLHRMVAVLRRNSLFVGSDAGGERAAVALSIMATCNLLGIKPRGLPRRRAAEARARDLHRARPARPDARGVAIRTRRGELSSLRATASRSLPRHCCVHERPR